MTSFTSQYKTLEKDYLIDIINKNQWEDETMLVMIDNYDSFTYNLYQYFGELGTEVFTLRNDQTSIEEIEDLNPDGIIISPGPCSPTEAGISNKTIKYFGPKIPILKVCLGHQCLKQSFDKTVIQTNKISLFF